MKHKICCTDMDILTNRGIVKTTETVPFTDVRTKAGPFTYLFNDGGHGGFFKIDYCPFCGNKIGVL